MIFLYPHSKKSTQCFQKDYTRRHGFFPEVTELLYLGYNFIIELFQFWWPFDKQSIAGDKMAAVWLVFSLKSSSAFGASPHKPHPRSLSFREGGQAFVFNSTIELTHKFQFSIQQLSS